MGLDWRRTIHQHDPHLGTFGRALKWMDTEEFKLHMRRGQPFLFDADQNPPKVGGRCSGGPLWPSQLTHGTILCFKQTGSSRSWRLALPEEHLQAMGFNMLSADADVSPIKLALSNLNVSQVDMQRMSGNSMYVKTQAAWMWYFLGHIVPRQKHMCRELGAAGSEWGDDDEF